MIINHLNRIRQDYDVIWAEYVRGIQSVNGIADHLGYPRWAIEMVVSSEKPEVIPEVPELEIDEDREIVSQAQAFVASYIQALVEDQQTRNYLFNPPLPSRESQ